MLLGQEDLINTGCTEVLSSWCALLAAAIPDGGLCASAVRAGGCQQGGACVLYLLQHLYEPYLLPLQGLGHPGMLTLNPQRPTSSSEMFMRGGTHYSAQRADTRMSMPTPQVLMSGNVLASIAYMSDALCFICTNLACCRGNVRHVQDVPDAGSDRTEMCACRWCLGVECLLRYSTSQRTPSDRSSRNSNCRKHNRSLAHLLDQSSSLVSALYLI